MGNIKMPIPEKTILETRNQIIDELSKVLDKDCVIFEPSETRAYECDALAAYSCQPLAVVLPKNTDEVSAALKVCNNLGVPVIPRGAGTSLAGGAMPTADSVVLGTAKLNQTLEIDIENRLVTVQTGVTNISVSQSVDQYGFFYAPDPSSQLACTIAGNIAMNSGGAHCLKYGVTTNNLIGLKMVMMDGEIIEIGRGSSFDSAGYDLLGLVCGSEGQLGVVTEATLRILPKPEGARPVLIGYNSPEIAGQCVARIIQSGILPVAIEYMDRLCIEATDKFSGAGYPHVEALLIVEVEGSEVEIDDQLSKIIEIAEELSPEVVRKSNSTQESALIWKGRKSAFGAMGRINDYMCLDGTVPVNELPKVLGEIGNLSKKYGLQCANVFHAGDGNMHPLILFDANNEAEFQKAEELGVEILKLCVSVGGCLSGEHGIGIEKRDLMHDQFNSTDLEVQMKIKDCFDPHWLLNPSKVFPLDASESRRSNSLK